MHKYDSVETVGYAAKCFVPFLVTNRINRAYWFVFLISVLYLITPLLKVLFSSRNGSRILICCIAVWGSVTVLRDFFPAAPVFHGLPVTDRFAGYYPGYYLCGYYLLNLSKYRPKASVAFAFSMLALAANIILQEKGINVMTIQAIQTVSLFAAEYVLCRVLDSIKCLPEWLTGIARK